jgi:hypothetical protein
MNIRTYINVMDVFDELFSWNSLTSDNPQMTLGNFRSGLTSNYTVNFNSIQQSPSWDEE